MQQSIQNRSMQEKWNKCSVNIRYMECCKLHLHTVCSTSCKLNKLHGCKTNAKQKNIKVHNLKALIKPKNLSTESTAVLCSLQTKCVVINITVVFWDLYDCQETPV